MKKAPQPDYVVDHYDELLARQRARAGLLLIVRVTLVVAALAAIAAVTL